MRGLPPHMHNENDRSVKDTPAEKSDIGRTGSERVTDIAGAATLEITHGICRWRDA